MTASDTPVQVRRATPDDVDAAAAALALAFTDDPWIRAHCAADEGLTQRLHDGYRMLLGEDWLEHAVVDVAELIDGEQRELLGLAIWEHPAADAEDLSRQAAQARAKELMGMDPEIEEADHRTTQRLHPQEPHWTLEMLTVVPAAQGRRVGSRLLAHGLERAGDMPVALESTTPGSRRLYERCGFELVELITDAGGSQQAVMRRG